jgi:hypothetical protein
MEGKLRGESDIPFSEGFTGLWKECLKIGSMRYPFWGFSVEFRQNQAWSERPIATLAGFRV